jgi:hypothetical protein
MYNNDNYLRELNGQDIVTQVEKLADSQETLTDLALDYDNADNDNY